MDCLNSRFFYRDAIKPFFSYPMFSGGAYAGALDWSVFVDQRSDGGF